MKRSSPVAGSASAGRSPAAGGAGGGPGAGGRATRGLGGYAGTPPGAGGGGVGLGADQDQRGDAFRRDLRGALRRVAAVRGGADEGVCGAVLMEHG
ncbi:hypothetical protein, partial [Nocardia abscessus]|uniref:hypothetical protein n=1 Tax=Nocardia abscessus TaxID=120957 RepID=UPI002453A2B1